MEKNERIIAVLTLRDKTIYQAPNKNIQLLHYLLNNQHEFNPETPFWNVETEFKRLSIEGKMKEIKYPYQWERILRHLENRLDPKFIYGINTKKDQTSALKRKISLQGEIIASYREVISTITIKNSTIETTIKTFELLEEIEQIQKLLEQE